MRYHYDTKKPGIVFAVATVLILLFVAWGGFNADHLDYIATNVLAFTLDTFGWFYMITVTFLVFICIFLAFSNYGKIKLGKEDDEPEYTFYTWLGMLFSAGVGVGFVFWGVAEPLLYYMDPPPGTTPETAEAAQIGMQYSVYHWALHAWAIFGFVGLVLADVQYRQNQPALISSAFYPLIGERIKGKLGKVIDILAVIATAMGVATTFGLSALQISGGLSHILDVPNNIYSQLLIILIVSGLFMISAASGLNKGIRILSIINLSLAGLLLIFMLFAGPTLFILEKFMSTLGGYLQHIIPMSLSMYPYAESNWLGGATIFYWAWHISWAPFMGIFIARISRGRTVREFILGVLIVPSLIAIIWFSTFGGSGFYLEIFQGISIGNVVMNEVELVLFTTLAEFPIGAITSFLAVLLIIIFFITSADSASYVLGVLTSKGSLEPNIFARLIWGILIASIASVLLVSGGLEGLQNASIIAALPFTFIICFMMVALFKSLNWDMNVIRTQEKERDKQEIFSEMRQEFIDSEKTKKTKPRKRVMSLRNKSKWKRNRSDHEG
ncbi:BCCT family transporter [Bacillus shivajii]|uniref:BCCT family transporter n=1 Tax=Bacillus shivajii TaxID=1983719 RepID=UPI001CFA30B9|nr:BCCT family transporter [Bacillus shivajii]UCZ55047.1 BCCT family transporter [Bacillus shivajii]